MKYIFIHGLGQNASSWDKTISHMPKSKTILCPELSLFLKGKACTYGNLYAAFSKYCDNISESLSLCGLSLGAVLALNYAIDNPKKIKSLILIAPQYRMPKGLLKFQNILFKLMPERAFLDMGFGKSDFIKLTGSMAALDFSKDLSKVSCPVLAVCGEKDGVNKKAAMHLAKDIVGAKVRLIKNSGHEVNIDAPEKLAKIIKRFYFS